MAIFIPKRFASTGLRAVREITAEEITAYNTQGFVFLRGLFQKQECDILLKTVEKDKLLTQQTMKMTDGSGKISKVSLWNNAGNDTYGMFARGHRMVNAVTQLIGAEPYHFHTKIMLKEPKVGGAWEWHQDFGYWYQVGCLDPNAMLSAIVAIDQHTLQNGCLEVTYAIRSPCCLFPIP